MAETPASPPRVRASLVDLFQMQASIALVCGIGMSVDSIPPNERGQIIPGVPFAMTTAPCSVTGYVVARCVFGRRASFVAALIVSGLGACEFLRYSDSPWKLVGIGWMVAIALYSGLYWLDVNPLPFSRLSDKAIQPNCFDENQRVTPPSTSSNCELGAELPNVS